MNTTEHLFDRIDPEERPGHAAPEEFAQRSRKRREALGRAHREAETEAVTGRHQDGVGFDVCSEMIGRHHPFPAHASKQRTHRRHEPELTLSLTSYT